ncbi:hypothetical protein CPT_Suzuki_001 [Stenotrophomonas phage Suzuki]|nr:hypothetical protein CPT_Suzuki_001 [Stenotrophomonas phage Suzuki]
MQCAHAHAHALTSPCNKLNACNSCNAQVQAMRPHAQGAARAIGHAPRAHQGIACTRAAMRKCANARMQACSLHRP